LNLHKNLHIFIFKEKFIHLFQTKKEDVNRTLRWWRRPAGHLTGQSSGEWCHFVCPVAGHWVSCPFCFGVQMRKFSSVVGQRWRCTLWRSQFSNYQFSNLPAMQCRTLCASRRADGARMGDNEANGQLNSGD
jgi:hypothetical protein